MLPELIAAFSPPVEDAASSENRARPGVSVRLPDDWPGPGPLDLAVHDLPHASSALEWWYVNTHFKTADGRALGVFAAFFRELKGRNEVTGELEHAHSIAWALSDPSTDRYHAYSGVDAGSPAFGLRKLNAGGGVADERLNRAMREVLARGSIPGPTRIFESSVTVGAGRLQLDYSGNRFEKLSDGTYQLHLRDARTQTGCDLVFAPKKPPTRHGNNGVLHGVADELMFYYFIPRCELTGSVTLGGERLPLASGSGWYDHEFGFVPKGESIPPPSAKRTKDHRTAWSWASVQLEGGIDVTVYSITRLATGEPLDHWAVVSDAQGERTQYEDVSFCPLQWWSSTRSFVSYPIRWSLHIPGARLELELSATFPDQEVVTVISDPGFWEGQVRAKGRMAGEATCGLGWVERKGVRFHHLDDFFKAAGKEVRRQVAKVLPVDPAAEDMRHLVVRRGPDDYAEGIDRAQIGRTIAKPIRDLIDRGGKAWRSYAAIACIDIVGGDSRKYVDWLAMPEIMHVGSLIVDDVEDRSEVRRGAPTCHMLYGEPLAINAGNAAYFLAEPNMADLPLYTQVRIYQLYFDGMRAGHAGQAVDIDGLHEALPRAIETGDVRELERRVMAIHRLKTGVPAGMAARIGALLGGGSDAQVEGLGGFFEAVGLAFQMMDDVLNLRGFKDRLKATGEDMTHGKLTLPVIKGLGMLPEADRRWLGETVASKPTDPAVVAEVIDRLEQAGAIEQCASDAREVIERAWSRLDPLVEESQYKVMFRAFSWYVLERHY